MADNPEDIKLTEEYYLSTQCIVDDIKSHDDNIKESEDLYKDMKSESDAIKRAGIKGAGFDRSKLFENMVRLRIGISDMLNKKSSVNKHASDLILKKRTAGIDADNTVQLARDVIKLMQTETETHTARHSRAMNHMNTEDGSDDSEAMAILDGRIKSEMDSGLMKLTSNEKAMKHAFKDEGVEVVYDAEEQDFKARSKKSGEVLPYTEFPRSRIPEYRILETKDGFVITEDGSKIPVVND